MMINENIQIEFDNNINTYIKQYIKAEDINIEKITKEILVLALNEQGLEAHKISLSIQSATKEQIKDINKEYRNIDKITDVLSFPIFERDEIQGMANLKDDRKKLKEIELGDIILCLDVIYDQSIEYGTGITRELLYMITHGICHLLGHDHIIEEDKIKMRALEEKILSKLGVEKANE